MALILKSTHFRYLLKGQYLIPEFYAAVETPAAVKAGAVLVSVTPGICTSRVSATSTQYLIYWYHVLSWISSTCVSMFFSIALSVNVLCFIALLMFFLCQFVILYGSPLVLVDHWLLFCRALCFSMNLCLFSLTWWFSASAETRLGSELDCWAKSTLE